MASLSEYIEYAEHVYISTDGDVLSHLLSLHDDHVFNENLWNIDIAAGVAGKCIAPLDEMLVNHLLALKALYMQNFDEAYNYQTVLMSAVNKLLKTQTGTNWMLPVMYTACMDLRVTAQKAHFMSGGNTEYLEKAAATLMECFRVCFKDTDVPPEHSKVKGILSPVNNLLRIFFKMNKFVSCKSIIETVEPVVIGGPFTTSEIIIFRFFVGRMAVVEADFRTADKHLFFAFKKCHYESFKNKRIILTYLVPVKMLLGFLPDMHLVEKYNLPLFGHLITVVREGQIKEFEDMIIRNQRFFASASLFTALENLRFVTYRNVFLKVYKSANSNRIPIANFQAGLQIMSGTNVDESQTQTLISSMIFNNKIKAYLSYADKTVVFNPHDPFPRLSTIPHPAFY